MAPRVEEPTTLAPELAEDAAAMQETAPVKPELETPTSEEQPVEEESREVTETVEEESTSTKIFDFASMGACCGFGTSDAEAKQRAAEEEQKFMDAVRERMATVLEELTKKAEEKEQEKVLSRAKILAARDAERLAQQAKAKEAAKKSQKKENFLARLLGSCNGKSTSAV